MKRMFEEFKKFIMRGNVLDMAVGVIVAGAFGKITTSLVNDIFMPFISWIFGTRDMTALNVIVRPEIVNEAVKLPRLPLPWASALLLPPSSTLSSSPSWSSWWLRS